MLLSPRRFQSYTGFVWKSSILSPSIWLFLVALQGRRDEMCLWSSLVPAQATGELLREDVPFDVFSLQGTPSSVSWDF